MKVFILSGLFFFAQNASFTLVSRARNSGSLSRHMWAALVSNMIWFCSMFMLQDSIAPIIKSGDWIKAMPIGILYTLANLAGAWVGHFLAMKTEKGKSAVGASNRYAQIPVGEWEMIRLISPSWGFFRDGDGIVEDPGFKQVFFNCTKSGWGFFDETGTDSIGPFYSSHVAQMACERYAKSL